MVWDSNYNRRYRRRDEIIMKKFESFIFIEKEPVLFGVALIDLISILAIFFILILFGGLIYVLVWNWPGVFGFAFFVTISLFFFLKITNKNRQPRFLLSLYSYYILQEKHIYIRYGHIKIQPLTR
jgi:hypothetical protein